MLDKAYDFNYAQDIACVHLSATMKGLSIMPSGVASEGLASLSLLDAGNERGTFKVFGVPLTAANFVAKEALWSTLVDAAMALVLGAKIKTQYGNITNFIAAVPTNGAAREIALTVRYIDTTTGQKFTAKLPTLDPTIPDYLVNASVKDAVLLSSPTEIVDFITAFNAFAINPYNGNATAVYGISVSRGGK